MFKNKAKYILVQHIIIDTDAGVNDITALLLFLKAEREGLVKIEAICCTSNGNTPVRNVCKNITRILKLTGRTDIPIYQGSRKPIICHKSEIALYHGKDGFGDLDYDEDPDLSIIKKEPSAIGMNEIVSKHPGEIYLVCLGPLTNAALAMLLYEDFASSLKEIYLMGGNYKAIGNVTRTAEFNFHTDPESVHVVLRNAKCPISIMPWETCSITKMTMKWRFEELGDVNDPMIQLLNKAEKSVYQDRLTEHWYPCDAFLAISLVYPECIEKEGIYHATIELSGRETRGQVVLDHLNENESNVRIIKRLDENFVKDILYKSFRAGFAK